jgi:RecJ-like exonuclease
MFIHTNFNTSNPKKGCRNAREKIQRVINKKTKLFSKFMSLYRECTECEGTGYSLLSNCCGAFFDTDIRICSECKEHIGDNDCTECNGQGKILKHTDTKEDY